MSDIFKRADNAIATAVADLSSSASKVISKGGLNSTPPTTPASPATVMPVSGDAATRQARRKSIAAQVARRGRASTIMTDNETLG